MEVKRIFDLISSSAGLVLFSPLLLGVALWVKKDSSGSVFFRQDRVGRNGKIFKIYKFRTMVNDAPKLGQHFTTQKSDVRITKVGAILRKFNIDELPQLINVVKGDMSLVGPRPEVPEIVKLYRSEQKKVLSVRPGLTDYASIQFRKEGQILAQSTDLYNDYVNKILPEKLKLQMKYVREHSLVVDAKIIFQTIKNILSDIT